MYGGTEVVEGKGKTAAKAPPAKRVRKLPKSVTRKPGGRKRKPALDFKDSSPPPLPLLQDTSESHDTEEKFPEGMESLEVRADASLTSPVPSRLQSATTSDHNNIHNNHVHEEQFSPSMFGTLSEISTACMHPAVVGTVPPIAHLLMNLFEEVGYHCNLEVATTLSNKVQTKNEGGLKSLPSINIDELFGII